MNLGYQHASHVIAWRLWLAKLLWAHLETRFVYSDRTFADLDLEEEREGLYR